jgi:uncharacterized protein YjiS (DUF1127 family)
MIDLEQFDITGKIGPLFRGTFDNAEWPMYSYERAAYTLWNAIGKGLAMRGWTESEIKAWLQSKEARWALDGDLGVALDDLGLNYAQKCEKVR